MFRKTLSENMRRKADEQTNLSEESSVKLDDVGAVAAPHDHVEIHQQLLLLTLVYRRPDPLHTHTHTRALNVTVSRV